MGRRHVQLLCQTPRCSGCLRTDSLGGQPDTDNRPMTMRHFAPTCRVTSCAFRTTEWRRGGTASGIGVLLVFSLALPASAQVSTQTSRITRETFEKAILLAGPDAAGLPFCAHFRRPRRSLARDRGVDASQSRRKRCTNLRLQRERRLSLRQAPRSAGLPMPLEAGVDHRPRSLALETWSGRSREYSTQIAFLTTHGGSGTQISGVRLSRDHVLAAQRAIERRAR